MVGTHAFVYIQHDQPSVVGRAVLQVNIARRQQFFYDTVVITEPRQGWMALLLGEGADGPLELPHHLVHGPPAEVRLRQTDPGEGELAFGHRRMRELAPDSKGLLVPGAGRRDVAPSQQHLPETEQRLGQAEPGVGQVGPTQIDFLACRYHYE